MGTNQISFISSHSNNLQSPLYFKLYQFHQIRKQLEINPNIFRLIFTRKDYIQLSNNSNITIVDTHSFKGTNNFLSTSSFTSSLMLSFM